MATKQFEKRVFILGVKYKSTSYYGNPSYWVYAEDDERNFYTGYTASNSACAYGLRNFEKENCIIEYHYTAKGSMIIDRVKDIKKEN